MQSNTCVLGNITFKNYVSLIKMTQHGLALLTSIVIILYCHYIVVSLHCIVITLHCHYITLSLHSQDVVYGTLFPYLKLLFVFTFYPYSVAYENFPFLLVYGACIAIILCWRLSFCFKCVWSFCYLLQLLEVFSLNIW